MIEIFHGFQRVASHCRSYRAGHCSTDFSHRPKSHQEHLKWTPERITHWASQKGPQTGLFIKALISKAHSEQGYRAALGVIRLSDKYGATQLDRACAKALAIHSHSYRTVKNILKNNMDKVESPKANEVNQELFSSNSNVRGKEYYQHKMKKIAKTNVLVLDDFGLTPIEDAHKQDLFEIVEDRYGEGDSWRKRTADLTSRDSSENS